MKEWYIKVKTNKQTKKKTCHNIRTWLTYTFFRFIPSLQYTQHKYRSSIYCTLSWNNSVFKLALRIFSSKLNGPTLLQKANFWEFMSLILYTPSAQCRAYAIIQILQKKKKKMLPTGQVVLYLYKSIPYLLTSYRLKYKREQSLIPTSKGQLPAYKGQIIIMSTRMLQKNEWNERARSSCTIHLLYLTTQCNPSISHSQSLTACLVWW